MKQASVGDREEFNRAIFRNFSFLVIADDSIIPRT